MSHQPSSSKARPNQDIYRSLLRTMTPQQKVQKAFELTTFGRKLMYEGLRIRNPDLSKKSLKELYIKRIMACHNRNY